MPHVQQLQTNSRNPSTMQQSLGEESHKANFTNHRLSKITVKQKNNNNIFH